MYLSEFKREILVNLKLRYSEVLLVPWLSILLSPYILLNSGISFISLRVFIFSKTWHDINSNNLSSILNFTSYDLMSFGFNPLHPNLYYRITFWLRAFKKHNTKVPIYDKTWADFTEFPQPISYLSLNIRLLIFQAWACIEILSLLNCWWTRQPINSIKLKST